jgi:hypothetical protein
MSGAKEAERELEKAEETIAMADRAIQISRQEQERLSIELDASIAEQAELGRPHVEQM